MDTKRQDYLGKYQRAKKNGYINSDVTAKEDKVQRGLQFRIAIHPDDLEKAAQVLSPILANENFKIMKFVDKKDTTWDGIKSPTATDRDQRGKECCIYIDNDNDKSPDDWKKLMLSMWNALQRNGVRVGYTLPPHGDRSIEIEDGVSSPFSYTCNKPFKQRYGILHEDNPNPGNFEDPLKDIRFTLQELKEQDITLTDLQKMSEDRLHNLYEHQASMLHVLSDEIKKISLLAMSNEDVIKKFENQVKQGQIPAQVTFDRLPGKPVDNIKKIIEIQPNQFIDTNKTNILHFMGKIDAFSKDEGLVLHEKMKKVSTIDELKEVCQEIYTHLSKVTPDHTSGKLFDLIQEMPSSIEQYKKTLEAKISDITQERKQLCEDFVKFCRENPTLDIVTTFLASAEIKPEESLETRMDKMIGADPMGMQQLYYKLVHMKHEEEYLKLYEARNEARKEMKNFCNPIINEILKKFSEAKSSDDLDDCKRFLQYAVVVIMAQEQVLKPAFHKEYKDIFLDEIKAAIQNQQEPLTPKSSSRFNFFPAKKTPPFLSKLDKLQLIEEVAKSKESTLSLNR